MAGTHHGQLGICRHHKDSRPHDNHTVCLQPRPHPHLVHHCPTGSEVSQSFSTPAGHFLQARLQHGALYQVGSSTRLSPTQLGYIWLFHTHQSLKQSPHLPPRGTVSGSHPAAAECLTQLHRVHPKHPEMELSLPSRSQSLPQPSPQRTLLYSGRPEQNS